MHKIRGFTLIELLVAVSIIGILTAVAVPAYIGYVDTTRATSAQNNLRAIYLKQQEYFTNNNAYYSTGGGCGDSAGLINTNLFSGQNIIDDEHYTYCITQGTTADFTAIATETSGDKSFSIDENNNDDF